MKGVAVAVGAGSRRFFWLDPSFGMRASSPSGGLGTDLRFGGIFTSVPAATSSMQRRDPVVVAREATVAGGAEAGAALDDRPGMTIPEGGGGRAAGGHVRPGLHDDVGGIRPMAERLDMFGLGLDYAMYHKSRWADHGENDLSAWQRLDGIFTSAPAAIAWGANRLDVFGVGMDHAMYSKKRVGGGAWTPEWQRLGGTFTSTVSPVSRGQNRLDIFARGEDFTLRGNHTDGGAWFGWQNHGGSLASPPVAISWGADRLDIFAIFNDGTLRHRWWDGQVWNEWEVLPGSGVYTGEPAAVSWSAGRMDVFAVGAADRRLYHSWFSNDTWSRPELLGLGTQEKLIGSASAISPAPNRLEVFAPVESRNIRIGTWDGQAWQFGSAGATIRLPSRYAMSVDYVKVETTRALNADTDAAVASVAPGNAPVQTKTQWIGELGALGSPKQAQTNLLKFESVAVDLAEPMSFSYMVVNNGHAPQNKILNALASASDSLNLSGSKSMQEDIANRIVKFASVKLLGAISVSIPVVGSVLSLAENWLMDKLIGAIFESCDGIVAVEMRAMMGRDLFEMTDNGKETVTVTTEHAGTDSPTACGANSRYKVTWTIKPL